MEVIRKVLPGTIGLALVVLIFGVTFFNIELWQVFVMVLIIFAYSFCISYIMANKIRKSVIGLAYKVEEMAAGNLSKSLEVGGKDSIGQLTNALNDLILRLKTGVAIDVSKNRAIDMAKTDFVTIASHQLRTPLSIIKWYADFLLGGDAGEITEEQRKYLQEIFNSNERLIELVNALLDVSRIDLGTFSIEPEPTNIVERVDSALQKFLPEIEKKQINLKKRFDDLPIINLDPRLMKIVFENIISNAVKYTPERGIVSLDIKKTERDILIKISDTGCGIPRAQQPKVFTKLFRADNVRKMESVGTGLGLYIVKAVIQKSGGKIWFESPSMDLFLLNESKKQKAEIDESELGTTFFITIPLKGMKKKLGTKKLTSIQ